MQGMLHLFLSRAEDLEYCFNIETSSPLNSDELSILKQILNKRESCQNWAVHLEK